MKTILYIALLSFPALADDAKPKATTAADTPPVISSEVRSLFWRRTHENDVTKSALDKVIGDMASTCGTKFQLQIEPATGEPTCAKPPAPPTPESKPKQ